MLCHKGFEEKLIVLISSENFPLTVSLTVFGTMAFALKYYWQKQRN